MNALFVFPVVIFAAAALQHKQGEQMWMADADGIESSFIPLPFTVEDCHLPPGQLLFLHVMKNGGTSVDAFLACHCKRVGCSMRLSLGTYADRHGIKKCERPSVCSTHGNYRNRKALCGEAFENPSKVFTVLRDPVGRVFSLYNYEKAQESNIPSITQIYELCDSAEGPDPGLVWLCENMVNHMTLQTFATRSHRYTSEVNKTLLAQAKYTISGLDAVFFMEDFRNFATAFRSSLMITHEYFRPHAKACELGHSNPTDCPTCAKEPTPEEKELIREHNKMDIMLYEHASKCPNVFRGDVSQVEAELGGGVQGGAPEMHWLRQTRDDRKVRSIADALEEEASEQKENEELDFDIALSASFSEKGYQQVAALKDDMAMLEYVERQLDTLGLKAESNDKLRAWVPRYSGRNGIKSHRAMVGELLKKDWVFPIAPASESALRR